MEATPQKPATAAFPTRRHLVALFAVPVLLAAAALLTPAIHIATAPSATIWLGGRTLTVKVADTPLRRSWGLQGRLSLAQGDGMLFVIDPPRRVTFARKTLAFPVDAVFVGPDAVVTGVETIDEERPTVDSPGPVGWVVEVPGGWAADARVSEGATLEGAPAR